MSISFDLTLDALIWVYFSYSSYKRIQKIKKGDYTETSKIRGSLGIVKKASKKAVNLQTHLMFFTSVLFSILIMMGYVDINFFASYGLHMLLEFIFEVITGKIYRISTLNEIDELLKSTKNE